MKTKELIEKLKKYNPEMEVVIFANGDWYSPQELQTWAGEERRVVEIGCGWDQIDDE